MGRRQLGNVVVHEKGELSLSFDVEHLQVWQRVVKKVQKCKKIIG